MRIYTMGWMQHLKIALINTVGALVAIIWVPIPQVLAQSSLTEQANSEISVLETIKLINKNLKIPKKISSLLELYQIRDQLKVKLDQVSKMPNPQEVREPWQYQFQLQQYEKTLKDFRSIEAKIIKEEKAVQSWKQALSIATNAVAKGKKLQENINKNQQLKQTEEKG